MRPDREKILSLVEQARGCLAVAMRESQGFEEEDVITLALAAVEEVLDEIEKRDATARLDGCVTAAGSVGQSGSAAPPLTNIGWGGCPPGSAAPSAISRGACIRTASPATTGVQALLLSVRSRFGREMHRKLVAVRPHGQGVGGES